VQEQEEFRIESEKWMELSLRAQLEDDSITTLKRQYHWSNPSLIFSFLAGHLEVLPILLEAPEQVRRIFGNQARLRIECVSDPEVPGSNELFCYIGVDISAKEASIRLRQLDTEWFLSHIPKVNGLLNFDVEFL
jgi:hypothetical protein